MIYSLLSAFRKTFGSVFVAFSVFTVLSCSEVLISDPETELSLLIYMAADNSLGKDREDYTNIDQLKHGYLPLNGNILIYQDAYDAPPRLFTLEKIGNEVAEILIEAFPEENSADPNVLSRMLHFMRDQYPAKKYGLIFWSHGMGWIPATEWNKYRSPVDKYSTMPRFGQAYTMPTYEYPRTKDIGQDSKASSWMNINDLRSAIPYPLAFILFDACLMGGIEVAYALRDKVDYMIASPTEIISLGFPYHQLIQPLFSTSPNLQEVCNIYYKYYNEMSEGYRAATIALYNINKIDALASVVKSIFSAHREELKDLAPHRNQIQCYDRIDTDLFFDLKDFISTLADPNEFANFASALDDVVVYKQATSNFLEIPIDPNKYSGIATYIPNGQLSTRNAYKSTHWNNAVRMIE